jgi:hypothetical protein
MRSESLSSVLGDFFATLLRRGVPWAGFVALLLITALHAQALELAKPVAQVAGTVYYVAADGDDSNPGTRSHPWKTLSQAGRTVGPGDTALIMSGEYRETLEPAHSGTPTAYLTFKAYPGEHVTVLGNDSTDQNGIVLAGRSYIVIEGFTVKGFGIGIRCQAPGHHIVLRGNTVEYNRAAGIYSAGDHPRIEAGTCDYMTIENNTVHHNGYRLDGRPATAPGEGFSSGIALNPNTKAYRFDADYSRFHSIIRRNTIYHNYDGTGGDNDTDADHSEGHGIIIDRGGDMPPLLIENNVIFDNGGACIVPLATHNLWIVGNTCYRNGTDRLFSPQDILGEIVGFNEETIAIKNLHVLNNIMYAREDRDITLFIDIDPYQLDIRNNVWFGTTPHGSSSPLGEDYVFADPQFVRPSVDPQVADFHLQSGSPAIAQGTSELPLGVQTDDLDGTPRPWQRRYDAGAFQYTGESQPPPTISRAPQTTP